MEIKSWLDEIKFLFRLWFFSGENGALLYEQV